jgi:hypothetical protein
VGSEADLFLLWRRLCRLGAGLSGGRGLGGVAAITSQPVGFGYPQIRLMNELFAFPNPVNEKAARVVAGVVLALVILILVTGWYWLLIPLAYGFWARVLTGPTLSPLGWTAQNVIAPRLGAKRPVPGPPKRFAQGMGAVMSTAALVLALVLGHHTAADVVLIALLPAAALESIVGYCIGCRVFGLLMAIGVIPEAVCAECADISGRLRAASSS